MTGSDARTEAPDLYRELDVDPSATTAEIARAYRRLARRSHPDVDTTPGSAERFARITHAYRVLSDPRARARYDGARAAHSGPPRTVPTRARTSASRTSWAPGATPQWGPDVVSRAASLFGGPSLGRPFHLGADVPDPARADEETGFDLSLEEAYHGTWRTVTVTSNNRTDTVRITIPPGTISGQRIEVPLTHLPGGRAMRAVVLRASLVPAEGYRVEGRDVHLSLALSPWEAALGATVALDTAVGVLRVEVPAGTSSGQQLILPGRGIPNPSGPDGDVCVHARVVVPDRLSRDERDLFERLAAVSTFDPRGSGAPQP